MSKDFVSDYARDGYCVVEGILSKEECAEFIRIAESLARDQEKKHTAVMNPDRQYESFANLFRHKTVIHCLEILQKSKIDGLQSMLFYRPPGSGGFDVHQDNFYPRSEPGAYIASWIPFEDADQENGGLFVYPGSHREPLLDVVPLEAEKASMGGFSKGYGHVCVVPEGYEKVFLSTPAGCAVFMHSHLIHGSDKNFSQTRFRRGFAAHYIKRGFSFISGKHANRKVIDVYGEDSKD